MFSRLVENILEWHNCLVLVFQVADETEVCSHTQDQRCVYLSFYIKCLKYLHIADTLENSEPRMNELLLLLRKPQDLRISK